MKERVNDLKELSKLEGLTKLDYYNGPLYRGDIVMIRLDAINFENDRDSIQRGNRPAIVIQNNAGNSNSPTIIVAAITSKPKKYIPTHVEVMVDVPSTILAEQLFTINKEDVIKKIII